MLFSAAAHVKFMCEEFMICTASFPVCCPLLVIFELVITSMQVEPKASNKSMRFVQELISTVLFMIIFGIMWYTFKSLASPIQVLR
jgi:hypothetical protein